MKLLCFHFAAAAGVRSIPGKCVIGLIVKINGLLLLHFIEVDVISSTQNKTGKTSVTLAALRCNKHKTIG